MALTLAMPLIGLEPRHFSALNMRLMNDSRRWSDSGRASSPSIRSESSGFSSLTEFSEAAILTPSSSRPQSPLSIEYRSQESEPSIRVMYDGRDILNLGANIRNPIWGMRDPWYEDSNDFMFTRSISRPLLTLNENCPTKTNYMIARTLRPMAPLRGNGFGQIIPWDESKMQFVPPFYTTL